MTNIYLLIYPKLNAFKIGKADNVFQRADSIKKWWGKPDYKNSFYLKIPKDIVFKLERGLHLLVDQFAMDYDNGDGKTEFFNIKAITDVIEYINIFIKSNKLTSSLEKGVAIPIVKTPLKPKTNYDRDFVIHRNKTKDIIECLNRSVKNMEAVFRVTNILIKYRKRIKVDFSTDEYSETLTIYRRKILANILFNYLRFELGSFHLGGNGGCNASLRLQRDENSCTLTFKLDSAWNKKFEIFVKEIKGSFDQVKKAHGAPVKD
ncbi:MAG: hypothetical protein ACJAS1_004975 [Oleiphilaceae bacterium]|jgi:hypothetical protein